MRVLIVHDFAYAEGGATQVALQQARYLRDLGCEVSIFTGRHDKRRLRRPGWYEVDGFRVWSTEQYELLAHPSRSRAMLRGLWNFAAARQFARVLDGYDPEDTILLLHGWTKILTASVVRVAGRKRFARVAMLHDYSIACPNGTYHDFQAGRHCWRQPMSPQCLVANCDRSSYAQKVWRVIRQLIQNWFAGLPGAMTSYYFVSEYQGQLMRNWLADTPSRVLRNHVEPIGSQTGTRDADVDTTGAFVFVGRFSDEKGGALFARASKLAGVVPVYIGAGHEEPVIRKLNPEARLLGWKGAGDIRQILSGARALVFPSLWHETFGLVVYEAASMGIPSIIPQQCAAMDFVEDGVSGLVFKTGDAASLARTIEMLEQDAALQAKLQKGAKQAYEEYRHSNGNYGRKLLSFLEEALNSG